MIGWNGHLENGSSITSIQGFEKKWPDSLIMPILIFMLFRNPFKYVKWVNSNHQCCEIIFKGGKCTNIQGVPKKCSLSPILGFRPSEKGL